MGNVIERKTRPDNSLGEQSDEIRLRSAIRKKG